jgi:hypothetical protein
LDLLLDVIIIVFNLFVLALGIVAGFFSYRWAKKKAELNLKLKLPYWGYVLGIVILLAIDSVIDYYQTPSHLDFLMAFVVGPISSFLSCFLPGFIAIIFVILKSRHRPIVPPKN